MIVVIAWLDEVAVHDGKMRRTDLGEPAGFVRTLVPRSVVWKLDGAAEDVEKARVWAAKQQPIGTVLTYDASESDPLGRARAEVVEKADKGQRVRTA